MNQSGNIEIRNLVTKFIDFYHKAKDKDEDTVWELWQSDYNFAAVPPGEQGKEMAKNLLKDAWSKYPDVIDYLESWKPDEEKVQKYLNQVKELLGYSGSVDIVLIYYVGGFENNAFVAPMGDGRLALCLSVECGEDDILLSHELTHIVHGKTAKLPMSWEKPIASLIIQEGLAMHSSKHFNPGKPDEAYTEFSDGWLEKCKGRSDKILAGITLDLDESSSDFVYKYTMGTGTTGIEREAYYVGWEVVSRILADGLSYKDIAEVKEENMAELVRKYI